MWRAVRVHVAWACLFAGGCSGCSGCGSGGGAAVVTISSGTSAAPAKAEIVTWEGLDTGYKAEGGRK